VTEHADRLICASCLQKIARVPLFQRRSLTGVLRVLRCGLSLVLLWFLFYLIGEGLASLPDSFHQGTLWQTGWFESE